MFIVHFTDDPEFASERTRNMPAHLAFPKAHAAQILAAGPLEDTGIGEAAGGLWLVRAPDHTAVEALVHADPLWPTGLRKTARILAWRRVFADGEVLGARAPGADQREPASVR